VNIGLVVTQALGGVSRSCWEFVETLNAVDRKNNYIIFSPPGPRWPKLKGNFRYYRVRTDRSETEKGLTYEFYWMQYELPRIVLREKLDILHSMFLPLPLLLRSKSIITVHDLSFSRELPIGHPRVYARPLFRWIKLSMRIACRILVPTRFTQTDIIRETGLPSGRISVVPWGVNKNFYRRTTQGKNVIERSLAAGRKPIILCVSELIPRKNIVRLIKAFCEICHKIPHDLEIVGNRNCPDMYKGFYRDVDMLVERTGLRRRIKLLSGLSENALRDAYRRADIFVYPSLFEGFGFPVLEAMANGLPVICSRSSSLPEIAGDAAVLVNPMSVQDLANEIQGLIGDERRKRELARLGLKRVKKFTWERTVRKTLAIYSEVGCD